MSVNNKSRNMCYRPLISNDKTFDIMAMAHYTKTADVVSAPTIRHTATRQGVVFWEYDSRTQKVRARHEAAKKWSKWMNTKPTGKGVAFSYNGHIISVSP